MINNLKLIQHQIYFIGYHYVLMEKLDHNQVNQLDIFGKKKMMQNFGKDIQFNLILFQIHQYAIIWINEHYMQIFFFNFSLHIFYREISIMNILFLEDFQELKHILHLLQLLYLNNFPIYEFFNLLILFLFLLHFLLQI